jgi:hypothetical protein
VGYALIAAAITMQKLRRTPVKPKPDLEVKT